MIHILIQIENKPRPEPVKKNAADADTADAANTANKDTLDYMRYCRTVFELSHRTSQKEEKEKFT